MLIVSVRFCRTMPRFVGVQLLACIGRVPDSRNRQPAATNNLIWSSGLLTYLRNGRRQRDHPTRFRGTTMCFWMNVQCSHWKYSSSTDKHSSYETKLRQASIWPVSWPHFIWTECGVKRPGSPWLWPIRPTSLWSVATTTNRVFHSALIVLAEMKSDSGITTYRRSCIPWNTSRPERVWRGGPCAKIRPPHDYDNYYIHMIQQM